QERKEQFRRIGRRSCRRIASVELTEIQLRHHVDNESGQMIGRQCLAQSDCQIEYGFVICGLKFSRHSPSLPPSQLLIRVGRVFRQAARVQFHFFRASPSNMESSLEMKTLLRAMDSSGGPV